MEFYGNSTTAYIRLVTLYHLPLIYMPYIRYILESKMGIPAFKLKKINTVLCMKGINKNTADCIFGYKNH